MEQNYQTTKLPTTASQSPSDGGAPWDNPSRITADDGSFTSVGFFAGGDGMAILNGDDFGFNLPPGAVVDGIALFIDGSNSGCQGDIALDLPGTTSKPIGPLLGTYGSSTDLWGADEVAPADIANIAVSIAAGDVSGGDGFAQIDFIQITVFWHIELTAAPADVPTRLAYKVYSREGSYLGELQDVSSVFGFSQDMNSAGSSLQITCGSSAINGGTTAVDLEDEAGNALETEDSEVIQATLSKVIIARGDSPDQALYKNSNRVRIYLYNYWYPNGKLMFSGQINRVGLQFGGDNSAVTLMVYSDGIDLGNFIARGYPFNYTTDVSQVTQDGYVTVYTPGMGAGFQQYGQTFTTGGAVTNVGAIALLLQGSANVTVRLYDAPNGNLLGSLTKAVAYGSPTVEQFEFASLLDVPAATSRFFDISVDAGQSINVYRKSTSAYAGGELYEAIYGGGSGGGSYSAIAGDLYFMTKYGTPTTTTTYTGVDPVTGMMADILLDYNARGGRIKRRNFAATGLSLTYTFNMATIADVQKKTTELAPAGYYSFIDLGTAEMDMLPTSENADFTIVRGKDINVLNLVLSIEQVKNYLLFTGGEVSGVNLFREYPDPLSAAFYGPRYVPKSDNRVVLDATADAIGETFIEENSDEAQETTVTVLNTAMDITKLTPGKTIGFRNFGSFIDEMILQIVRREYLTGAVTLTLGRLPLRMNDDVQRINRDLLNEQTANNPNAPS